MATAKPTSEALAILDSVAALPTMDELLARDPATYTIADEDAIVEHSRAERALWNIKSAAAEDKKDAKKNEQE